MKIVQKYCKVNLTPGVSKLRDKFDKFEVEGLDTIGMVWSDYHGQYIKRHRHHSYSVNLELGYNINDYDNYVDKYCKKLKGYPPWEYK